MSTYKRIRINGKVISEHRHIMECKIGRKLSSNELVHHINGIKQDNRPENLEIKSIQEHNRLHFRTGELYRFTYVDNIKSGVSRRNVYKGDLFRCTKCFVFKHKSMFYKDIRKWSGIRSYCKKCWNKGR